MINRIHKFVLRESYRTWAPLLVLGGFYLLAEAGLWNTLENITTNFRFQARAPHDPETAPQLCLIGIDEPSLGVFGQWPWNREVHGVMLSSLAAAQPATVGFDLLFTEPAQDPAADTHFATGIKSLPGVVLGAMRLPQPPLNNEFVSNHLNPTQPVTKVFGDRTKLLSSPFALYPVTQLRENCHVGFVDSDPNSADGIRRKVGLVFNVNGTIYPSLVTQMLLQYWKIGPDQLEIHLGNYAQFNTPQGPVRVPINQRGELWVNYRNQDKFHFVGYANLVRAQLELAQGKPLPEKFPKLKDSLLLVGQVAAGLTDFGPTPLSPNTPLVLVHLNLLNNILRQDFLTVWSNGWFLLFWLPLTYVVIFGTQKMNPVLSIGLPGGLVAAYVFASVALFDRASLLIPIVWPTTGFLLTNLGAVIIRWLEEQKSKKALKSVFASYISPGVMDTLLKNPAGVKLGGVRKPVTIFFSDIRGFTSFSEGANEEELVRQLNEYFDKMVGAVTRYNGTLHKYIGDAIMAVWGDVLDRNEAIDAKDALRCALAQKKELVLLNQYWKADGRMELKIGIGLNNGVVCVGNIGAPIRKEFTVIGDAVNTASRLEGVTKQFHTDLCIGESVYEHIKDEFLTRTLGLLVVKGKTKPLRVYEVLDDLKGLEPMNFFSHDWARRYEEGFNAYLKRDFATAQKLFAQCLEEKPDDYLSGVYLHEAKQLAVTPPGPDWTGVFKLDSK